MAVWPGDTEFKSFWVMRMDSGDSCNVGSVTMSLHTGTHADAPRHFVPQGLTPADSDLAPYLGPCQVIDLSAQITGDPSHVITAEMVPSLEGDTIRRILFKTHGSSNPPFDPTFAHLTPQAARALVERGVLLVGLDTPSVDYSESKTLDSHHILAGANIAILENLRLAEVSPGHYELIALPLKLDGMDASPVRAVLLSRT